MKTITIAMGILLLSCISAMEMKPSENYTIDFPNTNSVEVEFIGNSSNMDGFNWIKEGTLITYWINLNFAEDNFTVTWFNSEGEVDTQQQKGGGSSYVKKKVVVNETKDEEEVVNEVIEEETEEKEIEVVSESNTFLKIMVWISLIVAIFIVVYFMVKGKNNE